MPWIRLDDAMPDHPKIAPLSDAAFRWIFRALSYANRFLTDGELPFAFLAKVPDMVLAELRGAGVWRAYRGRTYIHDYSEYQPTKDAIARERQVSRERQARGRERQKAMRESRVSNGVSHGVTSGVPTQPNPSTTKTPQPPAGAGGRILRHERQAAEIALATFRRSQPAYVALVQREPGREYPAPKRCWHEPECSSDAACVARIVQEQREATRHG